MTQSAHRKQKIYVAATMGYALGSKDPEEVGYSEQIKKARRQNKDKKSLEITRTN